MAALASLWKDVHWPIFDTLSYQSCQKSKVTTTWHPHTLETRTLLSREDLTHCGITLVWEGYCRTSVELILVAQPEGWVYCPATPHSEALLCATPRICLTWTLSISSAGPSAFHFAAVQTGMSSCSTCPGHTAWMWHLQGRNPLQKHRHKICTPSGGLWGGETWRISVGSFACPHTT